MPVWDLLPPKWAAICRAADSTTFFWAHDGVRRNGWVELQENGRLLSNWCEGTWKLVPGKPDVVDMRFGAKSHHCYIKDRGFYVEEKFMLRTGKESYKPNQPKSCGWIATPTEWKESLVKPGTSRIPALRGQKRKGPEGEELKDKEEEPSFRQEDLKFDDFFSSWSEWRGKRRNAGDGEPMASAGPALPIQSG